MINDNVIKLGAVVFLLTPLELISLCGDIHSTVVLSGNMGDRK